MRDRHALTGATRIGDTTAWLQCHGATWKPADPGGTDIIVQQPGQPDLTVHIGDTLIWDGNSINVEPREKP